jgi:hypothetical protein
MDDEQDESPLDHNHLTQVETDGVPEYSDEFAAMILDENANGNFKEIDVDDLLATLDRMIAEATGKHSYH